MVNKPDCQFTAFSGASLIATGSELTIAIAIKKEMDLDKKGSILIFNNKTGASLDLNLQGTVTDVEQRYFKSTKEAQFENPELEIPKPRRPGRPKLGVIGHEVTLLPRHWEWLRSQPGGASVALRKLVDKGRRDNKEIDQMREAIKAINVFMTAMAGNLAGFEEANRALYSNDLRRFNFEIELWPNDIKLFISNLSENAFAPKNGENHE